ncbi:hypothetical protein BGZ73_000451 [Actinomortierella ambigua]|nr:hypothetical protein BGZ73_000451 [Actinomortierella ambigua]
MTTPSPAVEAYRKTAFYKLAAMPYPEWGMAALCAAAAPAAAKSAAGMPHFGVLMGFSAIYGFSGYMKHMNDPDNGSGTTTSWSLIYLFLNLRRTIRQPMPMPTLLVAGAVTNLLISGRKTMEVELGL